MTTYSKYNMVYRLQKWMDSVPGQTFLNYAYSWGASIVILGTLFKLTHIPGANLMLFIGMGTEVVVFFLSAFDRPFDKTAIGMELPTHLTDEHFEQPKEGEEATAEGEETTEETATAQGNTIAGTIIIGAGGTAGGTGGTAGGVVVAEGGGQAPAGAGVVIAGTGVPGQPGGAQAGGEAQGGVAYVGQPTLGDDITEATNSYVEQLQTLTEILENVAEQSKRLGTDSEEMENLSRTLTGISRVYEMQLKSASSQIVTIEEINTQTVHLARQIEQLNQIYARMIDAMTTNMGLKTKGE